MPLRTLQFFLRELASSLRRNTLMMAASVTTVMILVFLFGFFLLSMANVARMKKTIASEIEIHAYLKPKVSENEAYQLKHRLSSLPHVGSVTFISKEEALEWLRRDVGEEINLSGILENPLPAYLSIKVDDPEQIAGVARALGRVPEISEVNYMKVVEKLVAFFKTVERLVLGLVLVLLAGAISIIYSTIRLGVFSRKREIEIMQLVGATHGFIRWPFILEGAFYGLLGGALAILFLNPGYEMLAGRITEMFPTLTLLSGREIWLELLWLLALGTGVGSAGSLLSVNRYLRW